MDDNQQVTRVTVSVALCTYNGASYIEEQLESIFSQSRVPDELIIADDGSADLTLAVVADVLARHSSSGVRLAVLESEGRLGVTKNFERAVKACTGDLIALCDQDDVWHVDRIASALPHFLEDEALVLTHSNARLIDASGSPLPSDLLQSLGITTAERDEIRRGDALSAYIRRNLVTGATVLLRRSLAVLAMPFPGQWVHDEWLAILAAALGDVELLDEPLVDYRQHGANEIGVSERTLRYRIGRVLSPRGDRYELLAARADILARRFRSLGVSAAAQDLADGKALFERVRANYPRHRLARVPTVLTEARRGSYSSYSSQRWLDVLRDILQPE